MVSSTRVRTYDNSQGDTNVGTHWPAKRRKLNSGRAENHSATSSPSIHEKTNNNDGSSVVGHEGPRFERPRKRRKKPPTRSRKRARLQPIPSDALLRAASSLTLSSASGLQSPDQLALTAQAPVNSPHPSPSQTEIEQIGDENIDPGRTIEQKGSTDSVLDSNTNKSNGEERCTISPGKTLQSTVCSGQANNKETGCSSVQSSNGNLQAIHAMESEAPSNTIYHHLGTAISPPTGQRWLPEYVYKLYDSNFGEDVRQAFDTSFIREAVRRDRYGADIANTWKRGSTPEEARAKFNLRREKELAGECSPD